MTVSVTAQRIAVIGANGSGKSTFARLLNGLVRPSAGEVRVLGSAPSSQGAGFLFSAPDAQLLMPTVAEDVALSLRGRGLSKQDVETRVGEVLDAYGLGAHAESSVHSLSGGQKQLLAFASVLVSEPPLLIADEPTTLLDRRNARRIADLLIEELSIPTVIVTHDLELAARCEQAFLFDNGRLHAAGPAADIVTMYRELVG
ncbi:ABC transporter ATP-binding protein [uncultured Microbacterium sp.]|uniref:energy-coupling factor ABC transporter ATP-binding protein n=1 Tax=uncultured Microbacterium sp. TaxID=191216 RepID=UPI0026318ED7|nr:ABC transporter ATP-binding protein [uncultured Microbacterium sp.]